MPADAAVIQHALDVFCLPGQVVELRAIYGHHQAHCSTHADLAELALRATELDEEPSPKYGRLPTGIYFTPNPLRPDLRGSRASCKAADILSRRWLLIDCDSYRPTGTNATEAELACAWQLLDRCQATCAASGLARPVLGCSGNGWHLCYPIDLPNDEVAHDTIKALLKGLQERCGDTLCKEETGQLRAGQFLAIPRARVDTGTHDAPRIWKLYGTVARKGPATLDRPHRRAFLVQP